MCTIIIRTAAQNRTAAQRRPPAVCKRRRALSPSFSLSDAHSLAVALQELPALQGLGKLLESEPFPDVQVELDEALQAAQGHSTAKVHAYMSARCYQAWCAGPNGLVRHQNGVSGACRAGGITKDDVLFRHRGRAACAGGGR